MGVTPLYRRILGRDPSSKEVDLALSFLSSLGKHPDRSPWEEYAQVLLSTNELSFRQ